MAIVLTNNKYYKGIADAIRQKYGVEIEYKPSEMVEAIRNIDVGEVVYSSDGVAFSPDKVDPDVNYKVGRNWLADLVEITQKMAGKKSGMTLDDVIYWLSRVQFIPQGNAESSFSLAGLTFDSSSSGILLVVKKGAATSYINLLDIAVETSASGKQNLEE